MSYAKFQRECAHYGFLSTPISKGKCILTGLDPYGVACDVYAGATFEELINA